MTMYDDYVRLGRERDDLRQQRDNQQSLVEATDGGDAKGQVDTDLVRGYFNDHQFTSSDWELDYAEEA